MTDLPPISWFRNPNLTELTPLTVTPEGRVFGHIAAWGQNHLSFPDRAIRAPRSSADYRWFHTGSVDVVGDDDEPVTISVGKISQGGGHAGLSLSAAETARYYDDATSIVAVICAFDEDPNGIAFSGAVLDVADEVSVRRLKACGGVSGDWRAVTPGAGGLEMVACLAVPTGGFAIPRSRVASGAPLSLVAAGALAPPRVLAAFSRRTDPAWTALAASTDTPEPSGAVVLNYDTLADAIAARLDARREAGELSAAHAALVAELDDTPAVVAALLAEVDDSPQAMAALLAELDDEDDVSEDDLAELAELATDEGMSEEAFLSRMPPQLRESYLTGKVAARIRWGSPGDFTRCVRQAKVHGMGRKAEGACAQLHRAAVGFWPGDRRNR